MKLGMVAERGCRYLVHMQSTGCTMARLAMHDVVDRFNGKTSWKERYIKFTDNNGKRYEQFDGKDANTPCADCVFRGKRCQHPYYHDGSKGYCGKPYREVKTEE